MDFGKVDSNLTAIATGYRNRELIGDEIAPTVKTPTSVFKYSVWDKKNNFTIPQTAVGKDGKFNNIQFSSRFESGAVENHGLTTRVSQQDIEDYAAVGDEKLLDRNVESLRDVMLLRREVSIAEMVQDTANYAGKKVYAASNSWVNASSDPLRDIEDAMDDAVAPFNRMWFSRDSWVALKRHPSVIARLFPHSKTSVAKVREADIAEELELEKIVVGKGKFSIAEPGKDPEIVPAFNASAGLYVYREQMFVNSQMNFVTQVFLPQKETPESFGRLAVFVKKLDMGDFGMGGVEIRIGEQTTLVSQGSDLGYLFKNTTAK
jgi:hypothetical protein